MKSEQNKQSKNSASTVIRNVQANADHRSRLWGVRVVVGEGGWCDSKLHTQISKNGR